MERITKGLVYQAKQSLSLPLNRDIETHHNEISVYGGDVVDPITMAKEVAKLQVSFPAIDKYFVATLTERILKNNFSEKRLSDAVAYVLDNFKYQKPQIADIITFDKKLKIYSHNEVELLINDDKARFEDFYKHWVNGVLYRVKKTEADHYGITPFLNQNNS